MAHTEYVLHSPYVLRTCIDLFMSCFLAIVSCLGLCACHLTNMDTLALINLWFAPEPEAVNSEDPKANVSMHWVKPFCIDAHRGWVHQLLFPISTHCSSKIQPQIRTFTPCFTSHARSLPPLLPSCPLANHDELSLLISCRHSVTPSFRNMAMATCTTTSKDKNTFSTNPSHSSTAILLTSSKVVGSRPLLNGCWISISVSTTQIPICCGLKNTNP